MARKTFVGACDTCGVLITVPRATAKPLIDAIQAGQQDTATINLGGCQQVVKAPTVAAAKCSGTVQLVGVLMLMPRDLPYE
jgi:hypothetical protein